MCYLIRFQSMTESLRLISTTPVKTGQHFLGKKFVEKLTKLATDIRVVREKINNVQIYFNLLISSHNLHQIIVYKIIK